MNQMRPRRRADHGFFDGVQRGAENRYDFMKFQVFQWLIGATDGMQKTSPYLFRLAAVIDSRHLRHHFSISGIGWRRNTHQRSQLAMGLNASKGKKTAIDKIYRDIFWRQQRC